jgi:hypothetical protein
MLPSQDYRELVHASTNTHTMSCEQYTSCTFYQHWSFTPSLPWIIKDCVLMSPRRGRSTPLAWPFTKSSPITTEHNHSRFRPIHNTTTRIYLNTARRDLTSAVCCLTSLARLPFIKQETPNGAVAPPHYPSFRESVSSNPANINSRPSPALLSFVFFPFPVLFESVF